MNNNNDNKYCYTEINNDLGRSRVRAMPRVGAHCACCPGRSRSAHCARCLAACAARLCARVCATCCFMIVCHVIVGVSCCVLVLCYMCVHTSAQRAQPRASAHCATRGRVGRERGQRADDTLQVCWLSRNIVGLVVTSGVSPDFHDCLVCSCSATFEQP